MYSAFWRVVFAVVIAGCFAALSVGVADVVRMARQKNETFQTVQVERVRLSTGKIHYRLPSGLRVLVVVGLNDTVRVNGLHPGEPLRIEHWRYNDRSHYVVYAPATYPLFGDDE